MAKVRSKKKLEDGPQIAMMGVVPMDIALAALGGDPKAAAKARTFMTPMGPHNDGDPDFHIQLEALGISFHEVHTPRVETVEETDGFDERVRDAFVKLSPRLTSATRETFDGAAAAQAARDAGAIGVVLAPRYAGDLQKVEIARKGMTAREATKAYFDGQNGMSEEDREDAEMAVLRFLDAEGV